MRNYVRRTFAIEVFMRIRLCLVLTLAVAAIVAVAGCSSRPRVPLEEVVAAADLPSVSAGYLVGVIHSVESLNAEGDTKVTFGYGDGITYAWINEPMSRVVLTADPETPLLLLSGRRATISDSDLLSRSGLVAFRDGQDYGGASHFFAVEFRRRGSSLEAMSFREVPWGFPRPATDTTSAAPPSWIELIDADDHLYEVKGRVRVLRTTETGSVVESVGAEPIPIWPIEVSVPTTTGGLAITHVVGLLVTPQTSVETSAQESNIEFDRRGRLGRFDSLENQEWTVRFYGAPLGNIASKFISPSTQTN